MFIQFSASVCLLKSTVLLGPLLIPNAWTSLTPPWLLFGLSSAKNWVQDLDISPFLNITWNLWKNERLCLLIMLLKRALVWWGSVAEAGLPSQITSVLSTPCTTNSPFPLFPQFSTFAAPATHSIDTRYWFAETWLTLLLTFDKILKPAGRCQSRIKLFSRCF